MFRKPVCVSNALPLKSIPKDFYINQRGLFGELDIILEKKKCLDVPLNDYQLAELERLKKLMMNAEPGKKAKEIILIWEKMPGDFWGRKKLNIFQNPQYKYCCKVLQLNGKNRIIDFTLLRIVDSLKKTYGEVKLFPSLIGKGFLDLFKPDYTIDLLTALNIYDYSFQLVKQAANNQLEKMTADDNFIVLRELLDPLLYSKDLSNETVFNSIYHHVFNWDPKEELRALNWDFLPTMSEEEKSDYLNRQLSHCTEIQFILLNSLKELRDFQLLKNQPDCEVYCKKLYN